ncbi:MAG: T9SS type A sorting domain-containing protein [Ignavibacteria bacterium]|nr:T9SS type A sorting domain-containing protein [Ignavibacteria bacterium]
MKKLILIFFVLFFSNAFSQWTQTIDGRSVWSFGADKQNRLYAGGLTSSNSRIWRFNGAGWDTIFVGTGQTMWAFGFDTIGTYGNMYVANFSNGLLKSTNGGANFTVIPTTAFLSKNPQGVACSKNGNIFVTTATGFFRSTNGGVSFDTALTGLNCLPVLVDKDNQNLVYVGVTSAGGSGIGFYRSTDGGTTFSQNLNPGKNGYNLWQKPNGNLYMITTTSPYNFDKSTDRGLTWTTMGNMPNAMRGVSAQLNGDIYICGNGGAYVSTNEGANWTTMNLAGNPTPIMYHNNRVWSGISGASGGAFYYTIPTGINSSETVLTAEDFVLHQNYPNPFNPSTTIVYELKKGENISLKIYDAIGNELKEIDNGFKNAGRYEVNFNGENLSSGIYFAVLKTADKITRISLIMMK